MTKPCVVFDLDGTLADTSGDLLAAANHCFRALGLGDVLEHGRDSGTALRGGKAMLTAGFTRVGWTEMEEVDRQYPVLLAAYEKDIDRETVLYPGAMAAVEELKARGYAVAICTNKPEGLARLLLTRLQIFNTFDVLIGADTLPTRKPDVAPYWASVDQAGGNRARSCLIGDSITDHKTARTAGVPSILVSFGPAAQDNAALEPDALLADFADLPDLMDRMLAP